jgi:hypothetical protein
MQIGYNPGPKEVPLARRRGGAGLGGWVGGPASTAGHNGEAGPPPIQIRARWSGPRTGGLVLRLRDGWGTEVRGWSSLAMAAWADVVL